MICSDKPPEIEGFPMRAWSIRIYLLNEAGQETEAKVFEKVKYVLHPSFKNPVHGACYLSGSPRHLPCLFVVSR